MRPACRWPWRSSAPPGHPNPAGQGHRPAHPGGWPEGPCRQAGHAHHGGLDIIGSALAAYGAAHIPHHKSAPFTASGLLALFIIVGLATLGFIDDYIKVHKRRSLGLNKRWKIAGQALLAVVFALLAHRYTQASTQVSFVRPLGIALGPLFVLWVFAVIAASSNGVNLADGLDGLACGSAAMVMGPMSSSRSGSSATCARSIRPRPSSSPPRSATRRRTPSTSRLLRRACWGRRRGSCGGTPRPRIFMGDTGSLALGGAMGALALLTNTDLLIIVVGGLYVIEVSSVILQVVSFRVFGKRALRMAPLHHHFEVKGWPEFTVIVRFWILAGLVVAFGLGLFYADFIARVVWDERSLHHPAA